MKKLSLPHPSVSRSVFVITGLVIVIAVVGFAAARYEQFTIQTKHQRWVEQQQQERYDNGLKATIAELQDDNHKLAATHNTLCNYIKTLETNKYVKSYVTTPTSGNCSNPQ